MKTTCPTCKKEVEVPGIVKGITISQGGSNYNVAHARACPDCGALFVPKGEPVDDNTKTVGMQISM